MSKDQLDILDDDKLWDILDNFSNDKKPEQTVHDKYNQSCTQCLSINIIYTTNRGSYICNECGSESREILDDSPEWNNYDDKGDNSRCGAPASAFFPRSSLGTVINTQGYSKVNMLRKWEQMPYRERSLAEVLNDIDSKCKKYNITKAVIDNAKILYKNIRETKHESGQNKGKNVIIRGINRKQIIAACFYFGAILQKLPRSTKEVANIFNLDIKQITKGCRKFLEIMKDNFIVFDIKPSHGSDFIDRFGSKIKLSKEAIQLAKTISENTTKLDIASDHQATSIAAASILLSTILLEEDINRKAISDVFEISDVTISKTFKKIEPYKKIVIDNKITDEYKYKLNIKLMSSKLKTELKTLENTSTILNENNTEQITNQDIFIQNLIIPSISTDIESETDILIKNLHINEKKEPIEQIINISDDDFLDESDIVKKDNSQSKKNKLLLIQEEKNIKKLIKLKLKESKIKEKTNSKPINNDVDIENNLIKKKRGRPKKII